MEITLPLEKMSMKIKFELWKQFGMIYAKRQKYTFSVWHKDILDEREGDRKW